MLTKQTFHAVLLAAAMLSAPVAFADDDRNIFERGWDGITGIFGGDDERGKRGEERANITFDDDERELIRNYFDRHGYQGGPPPHARGKDLPPGLKKQVARGKPIPPGWQKKLARGNRLPDDIYAYHHPLPDDLYRRIPRIDGVMDIRVEGKVIRLLEATHEIVDILEL